MCNLGWTKCNGFHHKNTYTHLICISYTCTHTHTYINLALACQIRGAFPYLDTCVFAFTEHGALAYLRVDCAAVDALRQTNGTNSSLRFMNVVLSVCLFVQRE